MLAPSSTSVSEPFFVGEVVKCFERTLRDLRGQFGVVVAIGTSHVCVEYGPGRVYWIDSSVLMDAGARKP